MLQEAFNKAFAWQQQVQCDPQPDAPGAEAQHSAEPEHECSGQPPLAAGSLQHSQQDPVSSSLPSQAAGSDNGLPVVTNIAASCLTGEEDVHGVHESRPHGQQQQPSTATCHADSVHVTSEQAECAQRQITPGQQDIGRAAVAVLNSVPGRQQRASAQEVMEQHEQQKVPPAAAGRGQAGEQEG
jgi:hypothetical protein